ncbi:hypothetical protein [Azospirillum argentinense]
MADEPGSGRSGGRGGHGGTSRGWGGGWGERSREAASDLRPRPVKKKLSWSG